MKFAKDIFISYAHIDDESLVEDQKGWIADFHRVLAIRLAQLMGRKPIIWRDLDLQGNHIFDQQIVDQFSQVAVMISILTPRYVKSDWCIREVEEFYESCKGNIGFSFNNQSRIFKIIKTPVKIENHPEIIRNVLGYEFYTPDSNSGRIRELSQSYGRDTDKLYWDKLDDLANDISTFLDSIEYIDSSATASQVSDLKISNPSDTLKIYLAESSYETKEFRDSIRRELQDSGYIVYPNKQLPLVENVLNLDLASYFKDSDLSIHIIGENYGIVPEGSQKSIIEIQNDVASSISANTNLPRLIWVPEVYKVVDERQKIFLNKLNDGIEGIIGADLINGSLESLKDVVSDKIKSIEDRKRIQASQLAEKEKAALNTKSDILMESANMSISTSSSTLGGIVYLICDLQDIENIRVLEDYLFDLGYEVLLPIFDGDESVIRNEHIENLKLCDIAIIFYDQANEIWLRSKSRDFLKISGYGRETPLRSKILFVSGESNPSKERLRSQDMEVIQATSQFPADQLNTILNSSN